MTKYGKLIANFKPCTLQLNTWKTLKTIWFSLLSLIFTDCNINLSNSSYVNNLHAPGMKIHGWCFAADITSSSSADIRWNDRPPPHNRQVLCSRSMMGRWSTNHSVTDCEKKTSCGGADVAISILYGWSSAQSATNEVSQWTKFVKLKIKSRFF